MIKNHHLGRENCDIKHNIYKGEKKKMSNDININSNNSRFEDRETPLNAHNMNILLDGARTVLRPNPTLRGTLALEPAGSENPAGLLVMGSINADRDIIAKGSIRADGGITTVRGIDAQGHIRSEHSINTRGNIVADGTISAGGAMFYERLRVVNPPIGNEATVTTGQPLDVFVVERTGSLMTEARVTGLPGIIPSRMLFDSSFLSSEANNSRIPRRIMMSCVTGRGIESVSLEEFSVLLDGRNGQSQVFSDLTVNGLLTVGSQGSISAHTGGFINLAVHGPMWASSLSASSGSISKLNIGTGSVSSLTVDTISAGGCVLLNDSGITVGNANLTGGGINATSGSISNFTADSISVGNSVRLGSQACLTGGALQLDNNVSLSGGGLTMSGGSVYARHGGFSGLSVTSGDIGSLSVSTLNATAADFDSLSIGGNDILTLINTSSNTSLELIDNQARSTANQALDIANRTVTVNGSTQRVGNNPNFSIQCESGAGTTVWSSGTAWQLRLERWMFDAAIQANRSNGVGTVLVKIVSSHGTHTAMFSLPSVTNNPYSSVLSNMQSLPSFQIMSTNVRGWLGVQLPILNVDVSQTEVVLTTVPTNDSWAGGIKEVLVI